MNSHLPLVKEKIQSIFTGLVLILGIGGCPSGLPAQDTVKVMVYNLLQYPSASNYLTKNGYLDTIVNFVKPQILGVNELNPPASNADNILNLVLKPRLSSSFTRAVFSTTTGSPVANMLYYDSAYFRMKAQFSIPTSVREVNAYVLYYNDPTLSQSQDTTFLTIVLAHLKAGNTSSDSSARVAMSQAIVNWLNARPVPGNYIVMGDFNVYSSQEGCFQELLNASAGVRMLDPVNQLGNWNNNSAFANWFTQSTRTTSEPDGGSNGGMDDRLDHLLINESIRDNQSRVRYLPGSYTIVGQDGIRFNQSLTSPPNTAVPSSVAIALYGMSDHLPITAQLVFQPSVVSLDHEIRGDYTWSVFPNPVQGVLTVQRLGSEESSFAQLELSDVSGRVVLTEEDFYPGGKEIRVPLYGLQSGVYILKITEHGRLPVTKRIIKLEV
jgi:endonuclease/exonuclease/phosphatase family metal-dependent hydrolase